jgi:hypothetical protein
VAQPLQAQLQVQRHHPFILDDQHVQRVHGRSSTAKDMS